MPYTSSRSKVILNPEYLYEKYTPKTPKTPKRIVRTILFVPELIAVFSFLVFSLE
jgi:hypothetical protein